MAGIGLYLIVVYRCKDAVDGEVGCLMSGTLVATLDGFNVENKLLRRDFGGGLKIS